MNDQSYFKINIKFIRQLKIVYHKKKREMSSA